MNQLQRLELSLGQVSHPAFEIGDTVRVRVRVVETKATTKKKDKEEEKERIQVFEGVVIARRGRKGAENFTVRKISFGVGVERIYPLHSPNVAGIEVMKKGKVRRAKLYYLRDKKGKAAKIAERDFSRSPKAAAAVAKKDENAFEEPDTSEASE